MLDLLNEPQQEAVVHGGGPLVVFAGAGSGKTRVITHRVAWLVSEQDVKPWRILAVTFTNKAAGEMRERLRELLPEGAQDLWVGTFHATCARLLRRYHEEVGIRRDFTIYDDSDQKALVTRVLRDLGLDERRYAPRQVAGQINRAKQEVLAPDEMEVSDPFAEQVRRVYGEYEERLARAHAMDFGDLIYRLVRALESNDALREEIAGRFSHVLVDEFQDTNHAQYRLVRALCANHRNLCVVGDDDQSIYRWRGADRRNILDFKRQFPDAQIIKLEQNYRSTQRILRVANAVISRNADREPKRLWTENQEGAPILVVRCEDERDEARMIVEAVRRLGVENLSLSDMVVFYRTHAQSRVIEEAMRAADIPYRVVGGQRFYDRAEVKDLLAYMRVVHNPDDDVSLLRIINVPIRGIGKTTINRVLEAAARRGQGVWHALGGASEIPTLKPAARRKIASFVELMSGLRAMLDDGCELPELVEAIVERTSYISGLQAQDTPEADARIQNIQELAGSIDEFAAEAEEATLARFLELVTLQSSVDEMDTADRLTLMTIHAAKGLEFPVVLVSGLEEQMFPLRGLDAWEDPEEMEEERRLAYVAFTRAERQLILSWAAVRRIFGQMRIGQQSRFLRDLPAEDTHRIGVQTPEARSGFRAGRIGGRPRGGGLRSDSPRPPRSRQRPASDTESYVDHSEGSDLGDEVLRRGMKVRHAKYGVGRVLSVMEGVPPRVSVDFPGWGQKKIVVSYLEPC